MGAPEFFCYQEILAAIFTQSTNFLPLLLTHFVLLHKSENLQKIFQEKKKGKKLKDEEEGVAGTTFWLH